MNKLPNNSKGFLHKLSLPVIAAPLFLGKFSGTSLVISSCKKGIIGTFPALNARTDAILDLWISEIKASLSANDAPFGVNLIVHKTNKRLQENLAQIIKHKVPLVITSLGANKEVIDKVHNYGGLVYHDVTNIVHAQKAILAGVDGLIAVTAGAGGHAGLMSPFALIPKLRSMFDGTIIVAGAISTGACIRAAQTLGGDAAYMGTRFIATKESMASEEYKIMCINSKTGPPPSFLPTVYTDKISGVGANFLRASLENSGLNPDNPIGKDLGKEDFSKLDAGQDKKTGEGKAWKDIWSAGQGVVNIDDIPSVSELVDRLASEYKSAVDRERFTIYPKL